MTPGKSCGGCANAPSVRHHAAFALPNAPCSSPSTTDHPGMGELSELDARIETLEHELHQLKRLRSTYSSLCRLPNKLVVRIVWYLQLDMELPQGIDQDICYLARSVKCQGAWTRMMLVCSYLRSVVMNARVLWSLIPCGLEKMFAPICLKRCRDGPLQLFLQHTKAYPGLELHMATLMRQFWSRSRSIQIQDTSQRPLYYESRKFINDMAQIIEQPAPNIAHAGSPSVFFQEPVIR
jgi:hypothetical protein